MQEKILLLNMFSDYTPPEPVQRAFDQAAISAAQIDPSTRSAKVSFSSPKYISQELISTFSTQAAEYYGLRKLELEGQYPSEELMSVPFREIMMLFVEADSMNRAILAGA